MEISLKLRAFTAQAETEKELPLLKRCFVQQKIADEDRTPDEGVVATGRTSNTS